MYMHATRTAEGDLLLLNTLNGKTIRAKGNLAEEVEYCLNNPNHCTDKSAFGLLTETEFLLDETINEYERAENIFEQYRKDNRKILHLIILPTEDCNFRCWYCYEEHNKGKRK